MVTGLLLLVASYRSLVSPWYPITTSQVVPGKLRVIRPELVVPTTTYQTMVVYNLQSPVQLQSDDLGGSCSSAWYYCNVAAYWHSENLTLQTGVTYTVSVNECQQCSIFFDAIAPAGSTPLTAPQVNINVAVTVREKQVSLCQLRLLIKSMLPAMWQGWLMPS